MFFIQETVKTGETPNDGTVEKKTIQIIQQFCKIFQAKFSINIHKYVATNNILYCYHYLKTIAIICDLLITLGSVHIIKCIPAGVD